MPKTKVSKGSNGQYKVTVPKGLAEALDLEGKQLAWHVASGNRLEATIEEESG